MDQQYKTPTKDKGLFWLQHFTEIHRNSANVTFKPLKCFLGRLTRFFYKNLYYRSIFYRPKTLTCIRSVKQMQCEHLSALTNRALQSELTSGCQGHVMTESPTRCFHLPSSGYTMLLCAHFTPPSPCYESFRLVVCVRIPGKVSSHCITIPFRADPGQFVWLRFHFPLWGW